MCAPVGRLAHHAYAPAYTRQLSGFVRHCERWHMRTQKDPALVMQSLAPVFGCVCAGLNVRRCAEALLVIVNGDSQASVSRINGVFTRPSA
jgi:hypothetical protein